MSAGFVLVQLLYWLSLATWFGGVLFITVAAPIIFKTVRESDPTLPMVLSVNLESEHATLLAGSIVANLLAALRRVELACAGVLALCLMIHWPVLYDRQLGLLIVRSVLFIVAIVALIYDWQVLSPRVMRHRQDYIDNADEPDRANAAREHFDRDQRQYLTVLMIELAALLGLVLFSAGISTAMAYSAAR